MVVSPSPLAPSLGTRIRHDVILLSGISLAQKWRLLISINLNFINQRNEPHHEREHVKIINSQVTEK